MMSEKNDKIYFLGFWRKETEIRIIILFYFNNLINLFEENSLVFSSYINLNH